jgi:lipopolysaccharide biosynthesis regulator YciM
LCGPAALPLAAAGMAAMGSLMQGRSAMQQGNYEAGVHALNARIATDAAHDSVLQGQKEALQFYRKVGQVKGQQVAAMAANGIDVGSGTALTVQQDTEAAAQDDAANLYHEIDHRTDGFLLKSASDMGEAQAAKARGRSAMIGSVFQAAGSLMGGFSQMSALSAKMNMAKGASAAAAFGDSSGGLGGFGGWK